MDKNTKKIIAISSVTAAAVTATLTATYFTTKLLASIALDREAPPVIKNRRIEEECRDESARSRYGRGARG